MFETVYIWVFRKTKFSRFEFVLNAILMILIKKINFGVQSYLFFVCASAVQGFKKSKPKHTIHKNIKGITTARD